MGKIIDYKILTALTSTELEDEVRVYIEQGWRVAGGANNILKSIAEGEGAESVWYQTITLYETAADDIFNE